MAFTYGRGEGVVSLGLVETIGMIGIKTERTSLSCWEVEMIGICACGIALSGVVLEGVTGTVWGVLETGAVLALFGDESGERDEEISLFCCVVIAGAWMLTWLLVTGAGAGGSEGDDEVYWEEGGEGLVAWGSDGGLAWTRVTAKFPRDLSVLSALTSWHKLLEVN